MHSHMSCLVDNTRVSNLLEHMVSTTSLYEIHLCKLMLSSSHKPLCSMEDNPPLVDMCWVVILISCVTPNHSSCLYIQDTSSVYSSHIQLSNYLLFNYLISNYLISIIILIIIEILIWSSLVSLVLSIELLDLGVELLP